MTSEVVLTFKYGSGYDAPWAVVRAETPEHAQDLTQRYFGLSDEDVAEFDSLHDFVEAVYASMKQPGSGRRKQEPAPAAKAVPAVSKEAQEARPVVETDESLLAAVQTAASDDELSALWSANRSKFDSKIVAAAKKRRAELQA